MFIGEYQHSLDTKGRVIIPSKFREELGEEFVITKGLDGCLFVYSKSEWKKLEEKLQQLPISNKEARAFVRFFFAGATECVLDKQGRALLPQNLREHAHLKREAVVIGVMSRIEIWDREYWDEYSEDENIDPDLLAEKMADLGI